MKTAIQVYSNQDFTVRTTRDEDGTLWFVARDVMNALEYSDSSTPSQVMQSVPEIWKGIKRIDTLGGEQEMLCLTEQGLYFFLGRSDKPKALPYQMWIAGDVVPSIMETGGYRNRRLPDDIEAIRMVLEPSGIKGNQLTLALDKAYKRFTGYSALALTDTQLTAPTQHQLLTPTEIGRKFGMSPQRVNEILAGVGYQHKIAGKWEALPEGAHYAVMQDTGKRHSDGTPVRQLKWDSAILDSFSRIMEEDE